MENPKLSGFCLRAPGVRFISLAASHSRMLFASKTVRAFIGFAMPET
jgi:hypothetical protein